LIWQSKQIIAFIDDASRFVTSVGIFDSANTENALLVLNQAVKEYGSPRKLISDHGTQFTSNLFTKHKQKDL
jgi:putative transposase